MVNTLVSKLHAVYKRCLKNAPRALGTFQNFVDNALHGNGVAGAKKE